MLAALPSALHALLLVATTLGSIEDLSVSGRCVDATGKPVAGAQVATSWSFEEGRPVARKPLPVDAQGAFAGQVAVRKGPVPLVAYTDDGSAAGYALAARDALQAVEIVLAPTVRVHGRVTCTELDRSPEEVSTWWTFEGHELVMTASDDATFEDIQYHIYVLEKIRRGIEDIDAGRVVPHDEVVREFERWRLK